MRHEDVWRAIDALAAEHGLSTSGLARRAGLDPTTFNPSKRRMRDGRGRWPSTESLAKVLAATGASMSDFTVLITDAHGAENGPPILKLRVPPPTGMPPGADAEPPVRLPLIDLACVDGQFDDAGRPHGGRWRTALLPPVSGPDTYGIRVGGTGLPPAYRAQDVLVLSPTAPVRQGDRVAACCRDGAVVLRELAGLAAATVDLMPIGSGGAAHRVERSALAWMHRVMWISQ